MTRLNVAVFVHWIAPDWKKKLTLAIRETGVSRHNGGPTEGPPCTLQCNGILGCYSGSRGALNWSPLMLRDASLSDSCRFSNLIYTQSSSVHTISSGLKTKSPFVRETGGSRHNGAPNDPLNTTECMKGYRGASNCPPPPLREIYAQSIFSTVPVVLTHVLQ